MCGPISIHASETSGSRQDGDGEDAIAALLEQVQYSYSVANNGTVTLTNLTVFDTVIDGAVCSKLSLSPGESFPCFDNSHLVRICVKLVLLIEATRADRRSDWTILDSMDAPE